jgi:hypothetical protein
MSIAYKSIVGPLVIKGLAMVFSILYAKFVVFYYGELIYGELSKSILYGNLIFVVALFAFSNWVLADLNTRMGSFKLGLFGVVIRLVIFSSAFFLVNDVMSIVIFLTGFVLLLAEVLRVKGKFFQFELIKGFLLKSSILLSLLCAYTEILQLAVLLIVILILTKEIDINVLALSDFYRPKSYWMYSSELLNQVIANLTLILGSIFFNNEIFARISVVILVVNVLGLSYSVISNYFQKDFSTKMGKDLRRSFEASRLISGFGALSLSIMLGFISKYLFEYIGVNVNSELMSWLYVTLLTSSVAFSFGPIGLILDRTGNSRLRFISLIIGLILAIILAIILTLFLSNGYAAVFIPYLCVKIVPPILSYIFMKHAKILE